MAVKVIESMTKIYADLVANGRRTMESLPEAYKDPVRKLLERNKD